eukprot:gnl/Trimastix_PCT/2557.p1 GENE.gnl/Trimastix_PCT/2557~~gnl/Trimastix_PCT/2557.p1  ORF type:complete len:375 (+),score=121.97 gnl/Trimastix_PCT/2557:1172-2296(+)
MPEKTISVRTLIPYLLLEILAVAIAYYGSWISVWAYRSMKKRAEDAREEASEQTSDSESEESAQSPEGLTSDGNVNVMSKKDAMMLPVTGSAMLFGLYLLKKLGKQYVELAVMAAFTLYGVYAMANQIVFHGQAWVPAALLRPVLTLSVPEWLLSSFTAPITGCDTPNSLRAKQRKGRAAVCVTPIFLAGLVFGGLTGWWFWTTRGWLPNNLIAVCFCFDCFRSLLLPSFPIGALMLGGLFFYDIYWVFFTKVMVAVARGFDIPLKLVIPNSASFSSSAVAMLGLGDILIPGIFLAFTLRYDESRGAKHHPIFRASFLSYILALCATIGALVFFRASQPALLYISPFLIVGSSLGAFLTGGVRGALAFWKAHET